MKCNVIALVISSQLLISRYSIASLQHICLQETFGHNIPNCSVVLIFLSLPLVELLLQWILIQHTFGYKRLNYKASYQASTA